MSSDESTDSGSFSSHVTFLMWDGVSVLITAKLTI